jgi:hypothetical protein
VPVFRLTVCNTNTANNSAAETTLQTFGS